MSCSCHSFKVFGEPASPEVLFLIFKRIANRASSRALGQQNGTRSICSVLLRRALWFIILIISAPLFRMFSNAKSVYNKIAIISLPTDLALAAAPTATATTTGANKLLYLYIVAPINIIIRGTNKRTPATSIRKTRFLAHRPEAKLAIRIMMMFQEKGGRVGGVGKKEAYRFSASHWESLAVSNVGGLLHCTDCHVRAFQ